MQCPGSVEEEGCLIQMQGAQELDLLGQRAIGSEETGFGGWRGGERESRSASWRESGNGWAKRLVLRTTKVQGRR